MSKVSELPNVCTEAAVAEEEAAAAVVVAEREPQQTAHLSPKHWISQLYFASNNALAKKNKKKHWILSLFQQLGLRLSVTKTAFLAGNRWIIAAMKNKKKKYWTLLVIQQLSLPLSANIFQLNLSQIVAVEKETAISTLIIGAMKKKKKHWILLEIQQLVLALSVKKTAFLDGKHWIMAMKNKKKPWILLEIQQLGLRLSVKKTVFLAQKHWIMLVMMNNKKLHLGFAPSNPNPNLPLMIKQAVSVST